jgi:phosphatidate cytidylyltransferase
VLIPIVVYILIKGGIFIDLFLGLILIIATYEVVTIVNNDKNMSFINKLIWIIPILIYIGLSIYCIRCVINSNSGVSPFFLILTIWVFDTAAYFAGSLIGGAKLCPKISPKKTWSGLLGGIIITFFFPAIFCLCYELIKNNFTLDFSEFVDSEGIGYLIAYGFVAMFSGFVGQIGDLLESWFKRRFNVKESGNILPGHGGVLDRMDSIFLSAFFWYILACM